MLLSRRSAVKAWSDSMVEPKRSPGFVRRHAWALGIVTALVLLVLLFDWNWLRRPIEQAISSRIHREFHLGGIDVQLGREPTVRLRDIYVGNLPGAGEPAMARIGFSNRFHEPFGRKNVL